MYELDHKESIPALTDISRDVTGYRKSTIRLIRSA